MRLIEPNKGKFKLDVACIHPTTNPSLNFVVLEQRRQRTSNPQKLNISSSKKNDAIAKVKTQGDVLENTRDPCRHIVRCLYGGHVVATVMSQRQTLKKGRGTFAISRNLSSNWPYGGPARAD